MANTLFKTEFTIDIFASAAVASIILTTIIVIDGVTEAVADPVISARIYESIIGRHFWMLDYDSRELFAWRRYLRYCLNFTIVADAAVTITL